MKKYKEKYILQGEKGTLCIMKYEHFPLFKVILHQVTLEMYTMNTHAL